jgi:dTDP-4-amino-4,6-dideoxygalactose transaminase
MCRGRSSSKYYGRVSRTLDIPFNRPSLAGNEHRYIDQALASGKLSGNGAFAARCAAWLESQIGSEKALITPSCTAALEMAGILASLSPGDEVIVPDFAFVSSANAFALLGAVPVFVDIDPHTLNIDPDAIVASITDRTRAIVVIHYGGIACDMERIQQIAESNDILLIEDAAHSISATYNGQALGSFGHLAAFSFHETKNVQCGEGGALLVNNPSLVNRAEIIQEKGTNRSGFFRGEVDKYTWQDTGSSYLLSEVAAAFLWAQLEHTETITRERRMIWDEYYAACEELETTGLLRRPVVPAGCVHSGHLFYILLPTEKMRDRTLNDLANQGVHAVFHYVPLHSSPGGRRFGKLGGPVPVTEDAAGRLLRLPLWAKMGKDRTQYIIDTLNKIVRT